MPIFLSSLFPRPIFRKFNYDERPMSVPPFAINGQTADVGGIGNGIGVTSPGMTSTSPGMTSPGMGVRSEESVVEEDEGEGEVDVDAMSEPSVASTAKSESMKPLKPLHMGGAGLSKANGATGKQPTVAKALASFGEVCARTLHSPPSLPGSLSPSREVVPSPCAPRSASFGECISCACGFFACLLGALSLSLSLRLLVAPPLLPFPHVPMWQEHAKQAALNRKAMLAMQEKQMEEAAKQREHEQKMAESCKVQ